MFVVALLFSIFLFFFVLFFMSPQYAFGLCTV